VRGEKRGPSCVARQRREKRREKLVRLALAVREKKKKRVPTPSPDRKTSGEREKNEALATSASRLEGGGEPSFKRKKKRRTRPPTTAADRRREGAREVMRSRKKKGPAFAGPISPGKKGEEKDGGLRPLILRFEEKREEPSHIYPDQRKRKKGKQNITVRPAGPLVYEKKKKGEIKGPPSRKRRGRRCSVLLHELWKGKGGKKNGPSYARLSICQKRKGTAES